MTYRAGLIGAGNVGGWHADAYANTSGIKLTSISEIDQDTLAAAAESWDVSEDGCYQNHIEMLKNENLDVVSITSPTVFHHQHTLDAVENADLQVIWCEKPIAANVANAREMVKACEQSDTELVINHVRRCADPYVKLHKCIKEDNILGDVRTVNAQFKTELLRNGTHFVDTLCWLLGQKAVHVSGFLNDEADFDGRDATIPTQDTGGGGYIVLEDGTFITIDCAIPRELFSGWLFFTGSKGRLYFNESDEEVQHWGITDGIHEQSSISLFGDKWTKWSPAFERAAKNIVSLVEGDGENYCPGHEAVHVQEILIGLFISHYTNSSVSLPLDPPLRTVSISSW